MNPARWTAWAPNWRAMEALVQAVQAGRRTLHPADARQLQDYYYQYAREETARYTNQVAGTTLHITDDVEPFF